MPRKFVDDDMPRRRRGARAVAAETERERGFAMRLLLRSPKDVIASLLAFAAVSAIIANALFLQAGRHPSPMFGSSVAAPAAFSTFNPLPRPRPIEADAVPESRLAEPRAEPKEPRTADPLAGLVKATVATPIAPPVARPPAPIPTVSHGDTGPTPGSRRVAAVQRVLTEYGYGQLKPTGTIGSDTQAAIQKFEREHRMPPTGQMSDRLVRELTTMVGHAID